MTLRVLSLASLYPNPTAPNFGVFVARQMEAVAALGSVDLTLVNPLGMPPWPLAQHPRYRRLIRLPTQEQHRGVSILRPRFSLIPAVGARWNAAAMARTVLPLARRLHAERPFDLVDAQFFHPDGAAAVCIGKALGAPVSIKARGADIHFWGTHRATRQQVISAGLQARGLLAVSAGLAADMAALGLPRDNIRVHRTGLDRSLFRPLDRAACRTGLGLPLDRPVLVTVGALIERKGQSFAVAAAAQVPDAILLLAGSGPDESKLRAQAAQLGLSDRVRFLGSVPQQQLPAVLSAADVFVLPTASEGLANAWVEALACGVPVVTTPLPGARELLTEPHHGRIVARDGTAIAAAIRDILAQPPAPSHVAEATATFSWEANARELVDYWQQLAAR